VFLTIKHLIYKEKQPGVGVPQGPRGIQGTEGGGVEGLMTSGFKGDRVCWVDGTAAS